MTRKEYLDIVCHFVVRAVEAVGKTEALEWLHGTDDVVDTPWLDGRENCLEILRVSPNWQAYLFEVEDNCIDVEGDVKNIDELIENMAYCAVLADCGSIIDRIIAADVKIALAEAALAAAARNIEGLGEAVAAARKELEATVVPVPEDEPPKAA